MVMFLLEHGADPDSFSPSGETCVIAATRTNKTQILELLIEYQADHQKLVTLLCNGVLFCGIQVDKSKQTLCTLQENKIRVYRSRYDDWRFRNLRDPWEILLGKQIRRNSLNNHDAAMFSAYNTDSDVYNVIMLIGGVYLMYILYILLTGGSLPC